MSISTGYCKVPTPNHHSGNNNHGNSGNVGSDKLLDSIDCLLDNELYTLEYDQECSRILNVHSLDVLSQDILFLFPFIHHKNRVPSQG
jgi:hypothetical protein